jgi:hypothetical protein
VSEHITPDSLLGTVLDHPDARAVFQRALPGVANSPLILQLRHLPIRGMVDRNAVLRADPAAVDRLWAELGAIEAEVPVRVEEPPIEPDPAYEREAATRRTAELPGHGMLWAPFEIVIPGPSHGNPFVDVELTARFVRPDGESTVVGGFYDGDGLYRVRLLPSVVGRWTFVTSSTALSLDGIDGVFEIGESDAPGPVRVDGFHFRHADGTRHTPHGTTAYAWTHQPVELQERTLTSLAASPFTKVRMCIFPKSYLYNSNDPERYPFEPDGEGAWDTTRFDVTYWRHLEHRIRELDALGIQADLILFHAYDRWGFSDLGRAADERYVRYLTRRLAASPNVWWSVANEYDLLPTKSIDDWERLAAIVVQEDHADHLISIHNCFGFYDYTRPWITHCSVQRIDVYRTSENTDEWRERWGKPIVIDECAYEGDLDQGWGNITGEEMVRRFWEGAVRGGYVGHGETYYDPDDEVIWWAKGGELRGTSPARIGFLTSIIKASPTAALDPLPSEWDAPWGGVAGEYVVVYFGFNRPSFRTVSLPPGRPMHVDVIDTWDMTIERLEGTFEGTFTVSLPGRQYIALRMTAAN